MGEFVSPNARTAGKQRAAMASRLQSPTSPFFLGSNDDQLERAQARAARAAAIRRKPAAPPPPPGCSDLLGKDQITELFQNCIKLASENKINQKNTWELGLIDHLSEIIKVESEDDTETNFQKASCTLEAGVKIYALRVDSVHSEAYKVLGGINRAGREDDKEVAMEGDQNDGVEEDIHSKKESEKKMSPLSTLESSFEALNVKKFDVAFAVDPLYHQTSAQFDEGGAKGLLLNNLGVYGGCRVLFDSFEMPGKSMPCDMESDPPEVIDISFARECVEQMMTYMPRQSDISPTLRDIVNLFDKDNQRQSDVSFADQRVVDPDVAANDNQPELEYEAFENSEPCSFDQEDQTDIPDDSCTFTEQTFVSSHEESENYTTHEHDMDDRFENVADFLHLGLGFVLKQNAWAGPDHWKYRRAKGPELVLDAESDSQVSNIRPKNRKQPASDVSFVQDLEKEIPDIFTPPKNRKSLLLPAIRGPSTTLLPEDCHYQPEALVKLFLLPNIMCLAKSSRKFCDKPGYQGEAYDPSTSWDHDEGYVGDQFDEGSISDTEDLSTLVSQPRQVGKVEVQYDKSSKQVDVHVLKETLWNCMLGSIQKIEMEQEKVVRFSNLLREFPVDCTAAAPEDISTHLCFICLLHLANEHSLTIRDCKTLDELCISFSNHP